MGFAVGCAHCGAFSTNTCCISAKFGSARFALETFGCRADPCRIRAATSVAGTATNHAISLRVPASPALADGSRFLGSGSQVRRATLSQNMLSGTAATQRRRAFNWSSEIRAAIGGRSCCVEPTFQSPPWATAIRSRRTMSSRLRRVPPRFRGWLRSLARCAGITLMRVRRYTTGRVAGVCPECGHRRGHYYHASGELLCSLCGLSERWLSRRARVHVLPVTQSAELRGPVRGDTRYVRRFFDAAQSEAFAYSVRDGRGVWRTLVHSPSTDPLTLTPSTSLFDSPTFAIHPAPESLVLASNDPRCY